MPSSPTRASIGCAPSSTTSSKNPPLTAPHTVHHRLPFWATFFAFRDPLSRAWPSVQWHVPVWVDFCPLCTSICICLGGWFPHFDLHDLLHGSPNPHTPAWSVRCTLRWESWLFLAVQPECGNQTACQEMIELQPSSPYCVWWQSPFWLHTHRAVLLYLYRYISLMNHVTLTVCSFLSISDQQGDSLVQATCSF